MIFPLLLIAAAGVGAYFFGRSSSAAPQLPAPSPVVGLSWWRVVVQSLVEGKPAFVAWCVTYGNLAEAEAILATLATDLPGGTVGRIYHWQGSGDPLRQACESNGGWREVKVTMKPIALPVPTLPAGWETRPWRKIAGDLGLSTGRGTALCVVARLNDSTFLDLIEALGKGFPKMVLKAFTFPEALMAPGAAIPWPSTRGWVPNTQLGLSSTAGMVTVGADEHWFSDYGLAAPRWQRQRRFRV